MAVENLSSRRKRSAVNMSSQAASRRAALRKRAMEDYTIPETHSENDTASLLMLGVPEGAVAKGAAKTAVRFGPKGFKVAETGVENVGKYVMGKLKPILSKAAKAAAKLKGL